MKLVDEDSPQGRSPIRYGFPFRRIGILALVVIVVFVVGLVEFYTTMRIFVPPNHYVAVMKKEGEPLKNNQLIALTPELQGPQLKILTEGRYFYNPYYWWWSDPVPQTIIPENKIGILVRLYGDPLPEGEMIARDENQKGPLEKILMPAKYPINLWAYRVEINDLINIKPGFMGIVTRRFGPMPANTKTFIVAKGERGTQPFLLPPGSHPEYSNPYMYTVIPFDCRSQKFDISGDALITFPSVDSFDITLRGTIEWAVDLNTLPETFVKYVDAEDMQKTRGLGNLQEKLILSLARSLSRTVGGEHRAIEFLLGSTKLKMQAEMEQRMRDACSREGVLIKSFVIHDCRPPEPICEQYARREVAAREIDQYTKEILREIGSPALDGAKPKLDKDGKPLLDDYGSPILEGGTPRLDADGKPLREGGRVAQIIEIQRKQRNTQLGKVRSDVVTDIRKAEQYEAVTVVQAQKQLEVAKLRLEAAKKDAEAIRSTGLALANVKVMVAKAQTQGIKTQVDAVGGGRQYADYLLGTKLAPAIRNVVSPTEGYFADLFKKYSSDEQKAAK